ncbi:MAG: acyl-CoA dehydrogenase family protein [Alphaproteobacteria bacterium]
MDSSNADNVTTDRAELLQRARSFVPELLARADKTEQARRVSDATVAAFTDAGLFRILQPEQCGGYAYDMRALIDVTFELSRGCTSSGWVYAIGASHTYLLALFPWEVQQEVWAGKRDVFIAGSYAPGCMAERVAGGYRISGTWPFASGVDNAAWVVLGALLPGEAENAPAQPGFLIVPKGDYTIDDDWHTTGLCGTGSKSIVAKNLVVPAHRKLPFRDLLAGNSPGAQTHKAPLYRMPFIATTPVGLISTALGAVQGAIDEFLGTIAARSTRGAALGAGASIAQFGGVQSRFAEATACLDAARMLLYRSVDEALAVVATGAPVDIAMRIRNRRDHAFAMRLAEQAIDALDSASGGRGLYKRTVIQRAWRDVHAVGKHVSFNWDAVSTMYGQHAFGLEIKGQF